MAKHTMQGKAFEYACLRAIERKLNELDKAVNVDASTETAKKAFTKAQKYYDELSVAEQNNYDRAAEAATNVIFPLEPQMEHGEGTIFLSIMPDAAGQGPNSDVRDVLCVRTKTDKGSWEIGLSCKHNHLGVKHPRITEAKDFGKAWLGYPCSKTFMTRMDEITEPIGKLQQDGKLWSEIPDKWQRFYQPTLEAFIEEFRSICDKHEDAPAKLLSYFFGSNDFYKVISDERREVTHIQAFNINGTLNRPAGNIKPVTKVRKIKLPTRLIDAAFKVNNNGTVSMTTIVLTFDEGWAVSLRLHNKDNKIKTTGLSFEVELVGMASGTYQDHKAWD